MSKTKDNMLPPDEADQFYRLFEALLYFTNPRSRVKMEDPKDYNRRAEKLWKKPALIDAFIDAVDRGKFPDDLTLSQEDREILQSWKRFKSGDYFLARHSSNGSLFIDASTNVYRVLGIQSPLDQLIPRVPIAVRATLLPWKDKLITDGRLGPMPYPLPKDALKTLNAMCNKAVRDDTVITTF